MPTNLTLKAQPVQEPVAWMHDPESYSIVDTRQKEMNEFQYSPEFLAGHTIPLYRAPAQPVQPAALTISPLEEQQLFDDWCPYKGNPDPRVVWAAAVDAVNCLLGVRTGGAG